jgi:hypothetical protein
MREIQYKLAHPPAPEAPQNAGPPPLAPIPTVRSKPAR